MTPLWGTKSSTLSTKPSSSHLRERRLRERRLRGRTRPTSTRSERLGTLTACVWFQYNVGGRAIDKFTSLYESLASLTSYLDVVVRG
jgi:hypothetical protein